MNVVVLCGGVGAARFLLGCESLILSGADLHVTAIVNTGDDDEFYGMYVCPDIDSILYHLGGVSDQERGWGRQNETFHFVETLRSLGVEDAWFNLGDRDLALNRIRTSALQSGTPLRAVTRDLSQRLGIANIDIVPMCDGKVTTKIHTSDGRTLRMQEYFVREQCRPDIASITYENAPTHTHPDATQALENADLLIVAPSNPYLSIFPILAIDEIDVYLRKNKERAVVISPIVSGHAIKGPLEKNMKDLNVDISPVGIARIYAEHARTIIIDSADSMLANEIRELGMTCITTNTMMDSIEKSTELARDVMKVCIP